MTTPRKSERGLAPTKIDVKNKATKRHPVDIMSPWAQPTPTTDLPAKFPGFVIGGIGPPSRQRLLLRMHECDVRSTAALI